MTFMKIGRGSVTYISGGRLLLLILLPALMASSTSYFTSGYLINQLKDFFNYISFAAITGCRSFAVSQMGVITNPGFPQSTPGNLFCSTTFHRLDFPTSSVHRFRLVHVVDLMTNRKVGEAPNCS